MRDNLVTLNDSQKLRPHLPARLGTNADLMNRVLKLARIPLPPRNERRYSREEPSEGDDGGCRVEWTSLWGEDGDSEQESRRLISSSRTHRRRERRSNKNMIR